MMQSARFKRINSPDSTQRTSNGSLTACSEFPLLIVAVFTDGPILLSNRFSGKMFASHLLFFLFF